jgi:two-component system sensor histidine kinase UhpB
MTGHNGIAIPGASASRSRPLVSKSGPARTSSSQGRTPSQTGERRGSALSALWRRRSVRTQLLITILLIDLVAALAACSVIIFQTRTSVQVEVASSMKLADLLVQESIQMQQDVSAEQILPNLPLQLRFLRHVRISVQDIDGNVVTHRLPFDGTDGARSDERSAAPAWFAALMSTPAERHEFPVDVKGKRIGTVVVMGEPRDEIAEAWEHTAALGAIALVLNAACIGLLYLLFGRVLEPIARLAGGLADLERQNYEVRLPPPDALEFATITGRFNALAEALHGLQTENRHLNHRLITVQDDERRTIALDLHDEVGPTLFGLKAMVSSAAAATESNKEADGKLNARLREMLTLIEHMQSVNRSLLNRLRPMALGHVPLASVLLELIRSRERQHPHLSFTFSGAGLRESYGDSIDLTIYRCVQESVTNAMKHAAAKRIDVHVEEIFSNDIDAADHLPRLMMRIHDDGRGIEPDRTLGFGILGMQERVQALGGEHTIKSDAGNGTTVQIFIPLQGADLNAASKADTIS